MYDMMIAVDTQAAIYINNSHSLFRDSIIASTFLVNPVSTFKSVGEVRQEYLISRAKH